MQETDVIFGGANSLRESILKVHRRLPSYAIFVITSCPAGIIGEDVTSVVEKLKREGVNVFPITSDGIITGDYADGIFSAYQTIAETFVDETVTALTIRLISLGK
jgi:nitrogenase molybdenum-iron protein alpha chain